MDLIHIKTGLLRSASVRIKDLTLRPLKIYYWR